MKFHLQLKEDKYFSSIDIEFERTISIKSLQNGLGRLPTNYKDALNYLFRFGKLSEVSETVLSAKFPNSKLTELFYLLSLTKAFFFKGSKLIYEPFSKSHVVLNICKIDTEYLVEGTIESFGKGVSLNKCQAVFEGDTLFYIMHGLLAKIDEDIDFEWLDACFPTALELVEKDFQSFYKRLKESDLAPKYSADFSLDSISTQLLKPFLQLTDRGGSYANLGVDYGSGDRVIVGGSTRSKFTRDLHAEKLFEEDLLEVGYEKKRTHLGAYYCEPRNILKALKFLIELGWDVFDKDRNQVLLLKENKLKFKENGGSIEIDGSFSYGGQELPISDYLESSENGGRFATLDSGKVALLEPLFQTSLPKALFTKQQDNSVKISIEHLGVLGEVPIENQSSKQVQNLPFYGKLLSYQNTGLEFLSKLYERFPGGLLADEMGLGKTVQVLAFLAKYGLIHNILIVAPASLMKNWQREVSKFLQIEAKIYQSEADLTEEGVWVVSYNLLRLNPQAFENVCYDALILDEAQVIKNPSSKVFEAVMRVKAKFRLCLSGTPIENSPKDLWAIFHFCSPKTLGSYENFLKWQHSSASQKLVSNILNPYLLKRSKEEVEIDLPDRSEQMVYVDMCEKQRGFYEQARQNSLQIFGKEGHSLHVFETLLRLRQICTDPALCDLDSPSAKTERIFEELLEINNSSKQVLVFSQFTSFLHILGQKLKTEGLDFLTIEGSTTNRQEIVDTFQKGECKILLMSIKAGGVGLNITKADYVLITDPWWNVSLEEQAIGRAHRIGRDKPLIVRRYIACDSIEDKVMDLKEQKLKMTESLLEGKMNFESLNIKDYERLLS